MLLNTTLNTSLATMVMRTVPPVILGGNPTGSTSASPGGNTTDGNATDGRRRRHLFTKKEDLLVANSCVDYTIKGHFPYRGAPLNEFLPSAAYVARPKTLSVCELERLHSHCVERINMYRSGQLRFSDGTYDTNALKGVPPLAESTGLNRCSSHQAMGDLRHNNCPQLQAHPHSDKPTCYPHATCTQQSPPPHAHIHQNPSRGTHVHTH